MGAGCLDVVDGAGHRGRGPQQSAFAVGEDLDVHAVAFMLSGVVGPVGGDAIDRDQRSVQDQIHQPGGLVDDSVQGGRVTLH